MTISFEICLFEIQADRIKSWLLQMYQEDADRVIRKAERGHILKCRIIYFASAKSTSFFAWLCWLNAGFWDVKKNHPMSPDQVTLSSNKRAHWKRSVCLCEWQAPVVNKVYGKAGCPKCAKARRQESRWHQAETPYFCRSKACLDGAMGS